MVNSKMDKDGAIRWLTTHQKVTCNGCVHPQEVGWCEEHCLNHQAIHMAIEALEKQIPKKTKPNQDIDILGARWCECGMYVGFKSDNTNYCRKCGQAIDWSDENES